VPYPNPAVKSSSSRQPHTTITMPPRLRFPQGRTFVSHTHPTAPARPYTPLESTLLTTALTHVPTHGFTRSSLLAGLRDHGYPDVSLALFPRDAFSLVHWHLVSQRQALASSPPSSSVRELIVARLRGNTHVLHRWQDALAIMSLAENIPESLRELARLSDDIVFLSGGREVDTRWYTRRAVVGGVYAAAGRSSSSGGRWRLTQK